jgi:hypothetical protein
MAKDQKELPGMEDRKLPDLVAAANAYVKIRDKRQDLTKREVELKLDLLGLMHKHKKTDYVFDDVEIHVVMEKETVKVKVKHDEEEEETEAA